MNIKEIKELIKNTGFSFAVNKKRTLWKAFGWDNINPMPLPALLAVVSKGK